MADKIMYNGKQLERGERVTQKGKGWRLITTKGKRRYFVATLVAETNVRGEQVLVFRVAK